jgi:peptide deformylase
MAVRPVLRYPNAFLKRPADPVDRVTPALRAMASDLVDTMRASPATVGLAAPQVGESVRAFVLDVTGHPRAATSHGLVVLFDPRIVDAAGGEIRREGCLSLPDLTADVRRPTRIALEGLAPEGDRRTVTMEGFEARAALHEVDHLDGLLIVDRADSADALFPRRVYL